MTIDFSETTTTRLVYDKSKFQPTVWCDRQWIYLRDDYNDLGGLMKRIVIIIPLVVATLAAYIASVGCCWTLSTTTVSNNTVVNMGMIIGSGRIKTQKKELPPCHINEINFTTWGTLFIKKGDKATLSISTDDNIIDRTESSVKGQKLTIGMKPGSYQFQHEPMYVLTIPENLHSLSISGSGETIIDGLTVNDCRVSGSGQITINTKSAITGQTIVISGNGKYSAPNLIANVSSINISGSGRAKVHVKDSLHVKISGSGNCQYLGNPQIHQTISGSGSISPLR